MEIPAKKMAQAVPASPIKKRIVITARNRAEAIAKAAQLLAVQPNALRQLTLNQTAGKYSAETEKNLRTMLTPAPSVAPLLLFDEADALFGKRTEVRDAGDRYANLSISALSQSVQGYGGALVVAVSPTSRLDPELLRKHAFTRWPPV
jgi:ATP-dependent 26S proteasome regulatory subunit